MICLEVQYVTNAKWSANKSLAFPFYNSNIILCYNKGQKCISQYIKEKYALLFETHNFINNMFTI